MLIAALVASGLTAGVSALATPVRALQRTNFAGNTVSLAGGWAAASGLITAGVATGQSAALLVSVPATALGALDDHSADTAHKGLRGHLRALACGEVTTGFVKLVGIGVGALSVAATRRRHPLDIIIDASAIAAGANVANLLDLRPGRALKVFGAAQLPALFARELRPLAACQLAVIAAALPSDLAGRTMLGDTGANPLGAHTGYLYTLPESRLVRSAIAAGLVALIVAGEKVSFTEVIANHRLLSRLDELGRQ